MDLKRCSKCKIEKPLSEFGNLSKSRDGKKYSCKKCTKLYNKAHPIKEETKAKINIKKRLRRKLIREEKILNGEIKVLYDDGEQKECTRCGEIKIYSDYSRKKDGKNGLISHCKSCEAIRFKQWQNNGGYEKQIKYLKEYRKNNIEKCKQWAKNSREKISKEVRSEKSKVWREANKERMAELKRNWRKNNPNKDAEYNHKRRERLDGNLSAEDISNVLEKSKYKCYWCGEFCKESYQLDHYIPISKGGKNEIANIVISCKNCNLSKGSLDPFEFAKKIGKLL